MQKLKYFDLLQKVDFGICSITRSYERSQYVDFTHFTFDDQLKFITLKPKIKSRKWIISKPFSTILWLLIFLSLLALSTTIFLIAMFQASIQQFSSIDSFIKSIWIIFSAMSNQCKLSFIVFFKLFINTFNSYSFETKIIEKLSIENSFRCLDYNDISFDHKLFFNLLFDFNHT